MYSSDIYDKVNPNHSLRTCLVSIFSVLSSPIVEVISMKASIDALSFLSSGSIAEKIRL